MSNEADFAFPLEGRWTCRLTRRGWGVLGLGGVLTVAGLLWRYPGVFGLGAALALLSVLSLLSVLRRTPVSVRRVVWPPEVTRFGRCEATLRLRRSRGLFAAGLEAVEHMAGEPIQVAVPRLRAGRTVEVEYPIPTDRRGVLAIGPLGVIQRGVADLAENRASLGGVMHVRVLPRVLPVHGLPAGVRRGQIGADERVEHGGTDLVGLREYLPGDDLRRLHAPTSARTGTLMVREDSDPSLPHLTMLLDDRAGSYAGLDDLEEAVEVAASLAVAASGAGSGLRLRTVCGQIDVVATTKARLSEARRDIVYHLAEVTAVEDGHDFVPVPVAGRDVVAVVTGARAEVGPPLTEAARSAAGVLSIVDSGAGARPVAGVGQVTVLRGGDSTSLLSLWDAAVA